MGHDEDDGQGDEEDQGGWVFEVGRDSGLFWDWGGASEDAQVLRRNSFIFNWNLIY